MTVLSGGLFLIEVETAPNVWTECADLTRVTKANTVTISRTRVFRKTYRAAAATDHTYTLAGLLNYADPGQFALLTAERTNVPIRVRWAENGDTAAMKMVTANVTTITHGATPTPGELQTISFELHSAINATDFSAPAGTPLDLFNRINALGTGQALDMYIDGSSAVPAIAAAGLATLISVVDGAQVDGHRVTAWDSVVHPGTGKQFRPNADVNAGAGANSDGLKVKGQGLELPLTVGYGGGAGFTQDTVTPTSPTLGAPTVLDDHAAGIQWILFGRVLNNTHIFKIGEDGDPDLLQFDGDDFGNVAWLNAEPSLNSIRSGVGALPRLLVSCGHVTTPTSEVFRLNRYARDLVYDLAIASAHPSPSVARRVRLFLDGGFTTAGKVEANVAIPVKGFLNKEQWKLLADTLKVWYPDMWEDPRANHVALIGDSFQENIDMLHIANGVNGAPALPSTCAMEFAQGGHNLTQWQWPFVKRWIADADFSQRSGKIGLVGGEYLNGGSEAENYYIADYFRALGAAYVAVIWNLTYNGSANESAGITIAADLASTFAAHASALLDILQSEPYTTFNFGDGTTAAYPTGQNPLFWVSLHPTVIVQLLWLAFYREMIRVALGLDTTAITMHGVPAVDHLTLTAGAPSANPAITSKNFFGTVLSGKVWTHTTVFADGSDASSVATVDADGTLHRVAVGHCARLSLSNDGARSLLDVNST